LYGRKIVVANRAGAPDIVACVRGRFVGFEIKTEKGRQSELQKYNEREILRSGGLYFIIKGFGEFREILAGIIQEEEIGKRSEE